MLPAIWAAKIVDLDLTLGWVEFWDVEVAISTRLHVTTCSRDFPLAVFGKYLGQDFASGLMIVLNYGI
jgi:hypothetical protein